MVVDGSVRELRHEAKNALYEGLQALAGKPGLSKEEQLERLDAALAAFAAASESLSQARDIVDAREVANGEPAEDSEEDEDFSEEDDEDEEDEGE